MQLKQLFISLKKWTRAYAVLPQIICRTAQPAYIQIDKEIANDNQD